ncbi:MAG: HU family DNA-binding protein [Acidobacteria bacterium]|nr:HU family DNA-binding protein [Acidobacteriota bacterium]
MKKNDLARKLARRSQLSTAGAADQIDRAVHDILSGLRKGESVPLPGLGVFEPGFLREFRFLKPGKASGNKPSGEK